MIRKKRSLGHAFTEEIFKVTSSSGKFKKPVNEDWEDILLPNYRDSSDEKGDVKTKWRTTAILVLTAVLFFTLFLRLFHLQVVNGKENRELADGNRIKIKVIHAPRGLIYDRNGKILASNTAGFRLLDNETKKSTFISREDALELEVKNDHSVANLEVDTIRNYHKGEVMAHILGYVGEISPEQLLSSEYKVGDRIGQTGIEAYFEKTLRGIDGGEVIEVDAQGRKIRTLRTVSPTSGNNLYLTIDSDLQQVAFQNLTEAVKKVNRTSGVFIATNPQTGEILSMVSLPSFDNNAFTSPNQSDKVEEILADNSSPILNRAIGGTYPPGSTFKIVSSLAALDSGKVTKDTIFEDTGEIFLGSFRFTNWFFTQYGKTEGPVDLVKALKRSNDTYFYLVGQRIGEQPFIEWSKKLYLGKKLGIDLPGEVSGLVADKEWKEENFGEVWYPGDTLHLSIGQGFLLTTPLQVLGLSSFIAAEGKLVKPHLALKVTDEDGREVKRYEGQVLVSDVISKEYVKVIKQGLIEANKEGGTAWPFFTFLIETAGKTGTAEFGDPKDNTHAWYTAFGPANDPKIAAVALVDGGGEGSSVASPIVKEVFRWYFSTDKNNLIKDNIAVASDSAKLGE